MGDEDVETAKHQCVFYVRRHYLIFARMAQERRNRHLTFGRHSFTSISKLYSRRSFRCIRSAKSDLSASQLRFFLSRPLNAVSTSCLTPNALSLTKWPTRGLAALPRQAMSARAAARRRCQLGSPRRDSSSLRTSFVKSRGSA